MPKSSDFQNPLKFDDPKKSDLFPRILEYEIQVRFFEE